MTGEDILRSAVADFFGEGAFLTVVADYLSGETLLTDFIGEDFLETVVAAFLTEALGEGFFSGETLFMTTSLAVDFFADFVGDILTDFFTDLFPVSTATASREIGIAKPRPSLTGELGL